MTAVDVKLDPLAELPGPEAYARPASTALAAYATPSAQLQAMLQWAIAHPFGTAAEAAAHFGIRRYTAARIMNCDAFKVAYANALKEADQPGTHTLQDRVSGAIAQGVEILAEKLDVSDSPKFLLAAVQTLTKLQEVMAPRTAVADGQPINLTVNNQVVALGEARNEMLDRARSAGPYPGDPKGPPSLAINRPGITDASPYPDRADE